MKWIQTRIKHRVRQVEGLIHNKPTVVTEELRNSEHHLSQVTKSVDPNDSKTLQLCSVLLYLFPDYLLSNFKKLKDIA